MNLLCRRRSRLCGCATCDRDGCDDETTGSGGCVATCPLDHTHLQHPPHRHHRATTEIDWQRVLVAMSPALYIQYPMKKCSERRKHGALAVVRQSEKFRPDVDPVPGGAGPPKFNQLEMITTYTYKHSLVKIDARNFELSW